MREKTLQHKPLYPPHPICFNIREFIARIDGLAFTKDPYVMHDPDCIFCKIITGRIPSSVVYEDAHTFAFLDIAPFEKGHVLVVPRHHTAFLTDLPLPELHALSAAVQTIAARLLDRLPCDGFNLLQNNGTCATQVVPHVHFHIVPRWNERPISWTPRAYDSADEIADIAQRLNA